MTNVLRRWYSSASQYAARLVRISPAAEPGAAPPSETPGASGEPAVSSTSPVGEDAIADFTRHLEFFGYAVEPQPDGWYYAQHPGRYNLWLRAVDAGIRIHCGITIGISLPAGRARWLEFINAVNDRAYVGRFSLGQDDAGVYLIRVRALIPGRYDQRKFGIVMDMLHEDIGLLREVPQADSDEERTEESSSVTIN